MKKLLLVVLAAVGLASCVQTEELAVANNNQAIGFDTFVENVTKGQLYNTSNLDHFKVYGTISQNNAVVTNIFQGVEVTKGTNGWGYGSQYTQYWIPGFVYDFTAIVDGEVAVDANGMPATIEADMTEQEDILYATVNREFKAGDQASKVSFQFAHLLSKAKFTVKNTIANGQNFVYNIESVKITNAYETAEYNVAGKQWTGAGNREADFGVAAALAQNGETVGSEVLLVPGTKELAIAIKYNLTYNSAELVNTTKNLTAALTLEQGKAYNFIVEFGAPGEEIVFDVAEVLGWEYGDVAVDGTANVDTAEELTVAFAADGIDKIVLDGDILLNGATRAAADVKYTVAKGKSLTIDLNGYTIKAVDNATGSYGLITNNGDLSIVGPGSIILSATNERSWNAYSSVISNSVGGNLVVDGGVVIEHLGGTAMAYGIDNLTNGKGTVAVTTIEDATVKSTYRAVRQFLNGTEAHNELYVKAGAVIEGTNKSIWMQDPSKNANTGKLVVEAGAQLKGNVYLSVTAGSTEWPVEVSIAKAALVNGSEVLTNNVPAGYMLVEKNGVYSIVYELPQQNNEIWYTATALVHAHYYKDKFGEGTDLVSNVWDETTGKGVITLSGDVTKIGQNAFYYDGFHDSRENLISISLPNTVTEIGKDAFDQCPNLTTVTFNNNLVTIGPGAFGGCEKLTNVVLPEGLVTIGDNAFDSCVAIKNITIPAGVTSIGMSAFAGIKEIKVYCKPTTPPTVGYQPFNKWWAEIYVPTASLAAYQEAWGSVADNIYDGNF